jgi:glycine betaine/choline ABC-type transport system substrate-binding protein
MNPDPPDYSHSKAILIGTSAYHDKGFLPLPAAANSLKGLQEILVDPQLCMWPTDRVTALPDPADVRRLVANLRRWARETDDVLLLYFVGHGTITPRGELCLAVSDTEVNDPDITGIEYERVRSALLDSPARIKVVILDCCHSGRAIQALSHPADIADITDVRGVYTITASDHAAHVLPLGQQTGACTSFTGEFLDLIRTGIPDGPETLTLNMIYCQLRTRLHRRKLPAPNQRGTDTAGEFGFTRNAALLPQPLDRFPRQKPPAATRLMRHKQIFAIAAAGALAAAATFLTVRPGASATPPPAAPCLTAPTAPNSTAPKGTPQNPVIVGSGNFPESELLGYIYAGTLQDKGIAVTRDFGYSSRELSYQSVYSGQITVMPEYNGALLTTCVDARSTAVTTAAVDAALKAKLPSWLTILDPSPAQDQDTLTVTPVTAQKYHIRSILDLRRYQNLTLGAPSEFQNREQGLAGLHDKYGLTFPNFRPVDDTDNRAVEELKNGTVQIADIFSTDAKINGLVPLSDPKQLFTADNIVPLVNKAGINAKTFRTIRAALNAVSAKLTNDELLNLDTQIIISNKPPSAVAQTWLQKEGPGRLANIMKANRPRRR